MKSRDEKRRDEEKKKNNNQKKRTENQENTPGLTWPELTGPGLT